LIILTFEGTFFGAFAAGYCNLLGRRGTLVLGFALFIVGGILQTAAEAIGMLHVGRFVRWLWYRNSGQDCASILSRDLSCQHQRDYNFIAIDHVGGWRVGRQLD
jgi:MFS family permease